MPLEKRGSVLAWLSFRGGNPSPPQIPKGETKTLVARSRLILFKDGGRKGLDPRPREAQLTDVQESMVLGGTQALPLD